VQTPPQDALTTDLSAAAAGDGPAAARLMPLVYDQLRALAQKHMAAERADHTLQATAVVHEAYVRLIDQTRAEWRDRNHFFAVAANMIRRILVDHARARRAAKRGHDRSRLSLSPDVDSSGGGPLDLLDLDDALQRLAALDQRQARVVELRYFGGLTIADAADALGVSTTTVENEWAVARAWLRRAMEPGP